MKQYEHNEEWVEALGKRLRDAEVTPPADGWARLQRSLEAQAQTEITKPTLTSTSTSTPTAASTARATSATSAASPAPVTSTPASRPRTSWRMLWPRLTAAAAVVLLGWIGGRLLLTHDPLQPPAESEPVVATTPSAPTASTASTASTAPTASPASLTARATSATSAASPAASPAPASMRLAERVATRVGWPEGSTSPSTPASTSTSTPETMLAAVPTAAPTAPRTSASAPGLVAIPGTGEVSAASDAVSASDAAAAPETAVLLAAAKSAPTPRATPATSVTSARSATATQTPSSRTASATSATSASSRATSTTSAVSPATPATRFAAYDPVPESFVTSASKPRRRTSVSVYARGGVSADGGLGGAHTQPMLQMSASNAISESVGTGNEMDFVPRYAAADNSYRHHQSLSFGFAVSRRFAHGLSLESGLIYTLVRSDVRTRYASEDVSQKLHFIGIPLRMNWQFLEHGRFSLYIGAGGMAEKCVSAHFGTETVREPAVQWSAQAVVGAQYRLGSVVGLYFEPEGSYYFTKTRLQTVRTESPFTLSLRLGVRFAF